MITDLSHRQQDLNGFILVEDLAHANQGNPGDGTYSYPSSRSKLRTSETASSLRSHHRLPNGQPLGERRVRFPFSGRPTTRGQRKGANSTSSPKSTPSQTISTSRSLFLHTSSPPTVIESQVDNGAPILLGNPQRNTADGNTSYDGFAVYDEKNIYELEPNVLAPEPIFYDTREERYHPDDDSGYDQDTGIDAYDDDTSRWARDGVPMLDGPVFTVSGGLDNKAYISHIDYDSQLLAEQNFHQEATKSTNKAADRVDKTTKSTKAVKSGFCYW